MGTCSMDHIPESGREKGGAGYGYLTGGAWEWVKSWGHQGYPQTSSWSDCCCAEQEGIATASVVGKAELKGSARAV